MLYSDVPEQVHRQFADPFDLVASRQFGAGLAKPDILHTAQSLFHESAYESDFRHGLPRMA